MNTSLNSSNIIEENKLHSLENKEINTKITNTKLPNQTQASFNWKSYSNNKMVINKEVHCEEEQKYQNNPNDSILVNDDAKKVRIYLYIIMYQKFIRFN